ncbi:MAG: LemA-like protein [Berkelbacteria bacterium GW2011_GWA2_35_9]|uniref:LemA-like protein n=1 Tax=Berkelbacteria bacterium GW2011_GWA2_35_9 TaxID=1618333 RepID=A0A0G0DJI4_9BACT|nr:MAG: LemA-like protein [Berkelbacteria bacterium GW2011_GWA2_35_9]
MGIGTIVLIVFGVIILWIIAVYNGLITLRNRVKEAWSDISVQLKRRYDLIPNLIETVKGYSKFEKSVLTDVTKARTEAMGATGIEQKGQAENMLTGALKSLFAVSESYPDLKASQNFLDLQDELSDTENKIEASRRFYNGQVRDFNTKLETFPTNTIGRQLKFESQPFFEMEGEEAEKSKTPPKVEF